MTRTARLSLRVIVIGLMMSLSLGASALPLSPKWMKSSIEHKKVDEVQRPGEIGENDGPSGGGVTALPLPASIWLLAIGAAGMGLMRRRKS